MDFQGEENRSKLHRGFSRWQQGLFFWWFHSFDNCRNLASSNANKAPTCENSANGEVIRKNPRVMASGYTQHFTVLFYSFTSNNWHVHSQSLNMLYCYESFWCFCWVVVCRFPMIISYAFQLFICYPITQSMASALCLISAMLARSDLRWLIQRDQVEWSTY